MTNSNELNHDRPQDELPQPFRAAVDAILAEPTPDIDLTHFVSGRPMPATRLSNRHRPKPAFLKSMNDIPWVFKSITVVALAAAVIVLGLVLSSPVGSSIALAQVAAKVENANTLSFVQTTEPLDGKTPKITCHFTSLGTDRQRSEIQTSKPEEEQILISDYAAGKEINLFPAKKIAIITTIKGRPTPDESFANQMRKEFHDYLKRPSRSLGHKLIDGVECIGFEIDQESYKTQIWADAKTGNPVRSERDNCPMPPASVPQGICKVVQSDFKIDEKVEPALFSVEPPEGYKVEQNPWVNDLSKTPAQLVISILRTYAENMDGQFPARMTDVGQSIFADLIKKGINKGWDEQGTKMNDLILTVGQLNSFFLSGKRGSDYRYYPGGKLGEKDRIVFWYKDKKSDEYTTIYGDLRVGKIDKEKLPPPVHDGKE